MNNPLPPTTRWLRKLLQATPQRYQVAEFSADQYPTTGTPSAQLAHVIEQARQDISQGRPPPTPLAQQFSHALALLITQALDEQHGDYAFQLRYQQQTSPLVAELHRLDSQAASEQRQLLKAVSTLAHPAKLSLIDDQPLRHNLQQLYDSARNAHWRDLQQYATHLLALVQLSPSQTAALQRLLTLPALANRLRAQHLEAHPDGQRYRQLQAMQGPKAGSPQAQAEGSYAQQRGKLLENQVLQALTLLQDHLNRLCAGRTLYRAVSALYTPAPLIGKVQHAKTEWDAALLQQTPSHDPSSTWDLCLLIEAKVSADAATSDLTGLIRGLQLLGQAEPHKPYRCLTQQGEVLLNGSSLRALPTQLPHLWDIVLYLSNDSGEKPYRPLSPASRQQLLNAPASMAFAQHFLQTHESDVTLLHPIWAELLSAPRWQPVLWQHPTIQTVREHMRHVDDFIQAILCLPDAKP